MGSSFRRMVAFVVSALVAALAGTAVGPGAPAAAVPLSADAPWDPTTVLVKLTPSARGEIAAVARAHGARAGEPLGGDAFEVATNGRSVAELRRALGRDARVEYVEPNYIRRATAVAPPNDPHYTHQDELRFARLPQAWDVAEGAPSIKVAVLDTGADFAHPDLLGTVLPGYDFVGNDDPNPDDESSSSHGTLVAGVIGARTGNAVGIAGGAYRTTVLAVRVLDQNGAGRDSDIAQGIRWAADNAHVMNLSLGGPFSSRTLTDAISYARSKDVVVVASAGNSGSSEPQYPAAAAGVIAVGATDPAGRTTWFSQHGPWVDITAVGVYVRSTTRHDGFDDAFGTSFSGPQVAAAAALVRQQNPSWKADDVAARLFATARDAGPAGKDDFYGHGIVDAFAAVSGSVPTQSPLPPAPGDGYEPNSTAATATPIALSRSVSATIAPEGDVDWFAVDVGGAGTITAGVSPPSRLSTGFQGMNPIVQVYNADGGTRLSFADDRGLHETETTSAYVPSAGRYLVRVSNFVGSISGGQYALTVAFAADAASATPAEAG
ncbi:MAG TPA: S8 family serine peptidase, partial [Acidimicrobiales bacterium]|nr:S8 family serine peptidase [Acidimicrobiales bacterium]